ncbi:ELMO/CED-12 family, putative [Leishmania lindenbergi]|uniref:ELMO/CED-12 family n=1 Tax=Leishmania lindenbergi TaxID=651832 RepID=A0AAW3ABT2_9TRYP
MPPAARLGFLGSASGTTTEKLPASNAHSLRIPVSVLHYIQESYLPSARRKLVEVQQQQQLSSSTPALQVEYSLFAQMVAADVSLRALNVERATAFDKDNSSHVNLLQQLWMATGKSAATYSSLGPQWGSIGFQDVDPVTDLRGGGVLALRQLVHFAQVHNAAFREMLTYNERVQREGKHSWYLLAVVSIQLTTQLLLEQNYPLHVAHLEMLYDALRLGAGDATAKTVSRRAVAAQKGVSLDRTSAADTAAFWDSCKSSCSAEAGMFALHHALLLHFKDCWALDEPHVMEYNAYMSAKVYSTFFTTKWTDTTLTAL